MWVARSFGNPHTIPVLPLRWATLMSSVDGSRMVALDGHLVRARTGWRDMRSLTGARIVLVRSRRGAKLMSDQSRGIWLGLLVATLVFGSGCATSPVSTTTPETTSAPEVTTTSVETTDTTEAMDDPLALATERIRNATCWQKLNDRVNWMSDFIRYHLEETPEGEFSLQRLAVVAEELAGCDAAAAAEELAGADCGRIVDMVTDLQEATAVVSENTDHLMAVDLSAIVEQELGAFETLASESGCEL